MQFQQNDYQKKNKIKGNACNRKTFISMYGDDDTTCSLRNSMQMTYVCQRGDRRSNRTVLYFDTFFILSPVSASTVIFVLL